MQHVYVINDSRNEKYFVIKHEDIDVSNSAIIATLAFPEKYFTNYTDALKYAFCLALRDKVDVIVIAFPDGKLTSSAVEIINVSQVLTFEVLEPFHLTMVFPSIESLLGYQKVAVDEFLQRKSGISTRITFIDENDF
jgi:hypothetical protein